jgi:tetratricopeptide (TPR) repeat protein
VAGDSLLGQFPANGPYPGELHRLTLRAVRPLLQTLVDPGRQVDLSPLEDRQTAAVLRWLEGEREYRLSRFAQSLEAYEGALAIDSALVLAAIKGSQAANWVHDEGKASALIELAEQRADLLPDAYRDLAHGLRAYLADAADSAVFWLGRAVEREPDWAEAHTALGEVYYHKLPSGGALESTADAEFRAAQTADSLFLPPLLHIAEIALRRGDVADARVAAARYAVGAPAPEFAARLQLMLRCVEDPRGMRWAGAASPAVLVGASKALSGGASQWRCAEGAANAVLQDATASLPERWGAVLVLNGIFLATGRGAVARALVDSVVASGIGLARGLYILDAVAGGPMAQEADESDSIARERYGSDYAGVRSTGQLWLLGVWNAHVGRPEPLRAVAHELAARAAASGTPTDSAYAYAQGISTLLALVEGDSARALTDLAAAVRVQPVTSIGWGLSEPLPVERIRLAELLLAQGRHGDAIAAAEVFDHHEPVAFLPFLVPSLEVRVRAAEAARSGTLAASYRERLASLGWLGEEP